MKIPKKGTRMKVKSLGIKGTIFYVDNPNIYNHHMHPVQVELDKPYDESGQTMYRTNLKDLVSVKKKATAWQEEVKDQVKRKVKSKPAPKEKKVDEMEDLNRIEEFQVGKTYMLFVKKKTHIEPTSAKIINISGEGVRCYLTHKGEMKKKTIPVDKFLKQYRRAYDGFKNAEVTVRKTKKVKEKEPELELDWS